VLTPDERRGARVLLLIVVAGALWDLTRAWRPAMAPFPEPAPGAIEAGASSDTASAATAAVSAIPRERSSKSAVRDTIDLNRASAAELEALPGIGPVLAQRICEHRRREGPFRTVDELRAVRGVGPRLLERVRDRLRVSGG
jgi:competence protein ComEA